MRTPSRPVLALCLLGSIVLGFHVLLAARWVARDAQPPAWDPAVHLGTAQDYRDAATAGRWLDVLRTKPRPGHPPYPPLYHYSIIPILCAERPHEAVVWINLLYLTLLVGAGACIGFQLGGAGPACATLLALSLSPGVLYKFREAFPDLSISAWVTLAYALVLRSQLWERRGWSLGAGACAALALYCKWGAVLYLLPAAAAGLVTPARRRNLGSALALSLLCAPWYVLNLPQLIPRVWASTTLGHHQGQPLTWTLSNWWFYPYFLGVCFSLPGLLLLLAGCARALCAKDEARRIVGAWLAFSYLFCTLVPSKDTRYFLPAVAALPALGAAGLTAPALALSGVFSLAAARNIRRPEPADWHDRDILQAIARRQRPQGLTMVCVLANHARLNSTSFAWQARHARLGRVAVGCSESEIPEWADLVLLKTGQDPGVFMGENTRAILAQAAAGSGLFGQVFREAGRWSLPDGSDAVLYEQRPDVPLLRHEIFRSRTRVRSAQLQDVRVKPLGGTNFEVDIKTLTLEKLPAPIRDVRVRLYGARLLPYKDRLYVLGLERMELLSASLAWGHLSQALTKRSRLPVVALNEEGGVILRGRLSFLVAELVLDAVADDDWIQVSVRRARLGGLPLPVSGLRLRQPLTPEAPNRPFDIDVLPLNFHADGLRVGKP